MVFVIRILYCFHLTLKATIFAFVLKQGENATFVYTIYENSGAFKLRTIPVTGQTELVVKDSALLNGLDSTEVQVNFVSSFLFVIII